MKTKIKLFCILLSFSLNSTITINAQDIEDIEVEAPLLELLMSGKDIDGNFISYTQSELMCRYIIHNAKMYYEETVRDSYIKKQYIHSVDVESFKDLGYKYAKDKYRVYYEGEILLGIDAMSFDTKVLEDEKHEDNNLAKDKKHIISNGIVIRESDAETFKRIALRYYADKNNIYNAACTMLHDADPNNFRYLQYNTLISNNNVYCGSEIVAEADADSFESCDNFKYFKDKNHYYYDRFCLEGSDSSLELVEGAPPFYSNNGNLYAENIKIDTNDTTLPKSVGAIQYCKNSAAVYWHGDRIEYADPDTFTEIADNYAQDAKGLYRYDHFVCYTNGSPIKQLDKDMLYDSLSLYYVRYGELEKKIDIDINSFQRIRPSYYLDKNGVYYIDSTKLFPQLIRMDNVDANSFESINKYYSKDKNHVYYLNKVSKGIDSGSFYVMKDGYAKDKNNVYYCGNRLESLASSATIGKIAPPYLIADNRVFYAHAEIKDADADSFEIINDIYAKDANAAYYQNAKFVDADPKTFRVISDRISCDRKHVWLGGTLMGKVDGASFARLEKRVYKDDNYLYINPFYDIEEKKIAIDGKTLQSVGDNYWADKNNVYIGLLSYLNDNTDNPSPNNTSYVNGFSKIERADPKTFVGMDNAYSKDKNNVYYLDKIIAGADPKSFIIIDDKRGFETAYDKKHIYSQDKVVENIGSSFIYMGNQFFKDKKYMYKIYHGGAIKKYHIKNDMKLDAKSLKLMDYNFFEDKNKAYNWQVIKK